VEEELLDHVGVVAEAEDELRVPEVRVVLHQVPEDRAVADLDHRLRDLSRVLAQPGAKAPAEQDDLHGSPPGTRNAGRNRFAFQMEHFILTAPVEGNTAVRKPGKS